MPERDPIDVKNLDIYGSEALPWSRARDELARPPDPNNPGGDNTPFLSTTAPDGSPDTAAVGAVWHDGDFYFTSGAGNPQSAQPGAAPARHVRRAPRWDRRGPGGRGEPRDRCRNAGDPGADVPRWRLAGQGGRRCLHRRVQRAERRATAMEPLSLPHRYRVWRGHAGAVGGYEVEICGVSIVGPHLPEKPSPRPSPSGRGCADVDMRCQMATHLVSTPLRTYHPESGVDFLTHQGADARDSAKIASSFPHTPFKRSSCPSEK